MRAPSRGERTQEAAIRRFCIAGAKCLLLSATGIRSEANMVGGQGTFTNTNLNV